MPELSPIVKELERLRDVLPGIYPVLALPTERVGELPPIVSVASKGRKRNVFSWYNEARWSDTFEDALDALAGFDDTAEQVAARVQTRRAELVVAAESLGDPIKAVSQLVRVMLQHAGRAKVGANFYYGVEWRHVAWKVDHESAPLIDQPTKGLADWRPTQKFIDKVSPLIDHSVFEVARDSEADRAKVGSRMRKWTCGCTIVRTAVELRATCGRCNQQFMWAEPYADAVAKWGTHGVARMTNMGLIGPDPTLTEGSV